MRRNKPPNAVGRPHSICANFTVFSCASLRTALHLERRTARGNVRLLNGGFGEKAAVRIARVRQAEWPQTAQSSRCLSRKIRANCGIGSRIWGRGGNP